MTIPEFSGVRANIVLMSLRDVKVLACSPQNSWVFNSSRIISMKDSAHCSGLPLPGLERAFGELVKPVISIDEVSGAHLMSLGALLDEAFWFSSPVPG